ncbi:hypothetical protein ABG768_005978 [Culter alburnus]|uniref:Tastin n=1 Tax=Culter alburnus TaxID=194366 RepID=A0AAW1ZXB3_CULAL
MKQHEVAPVPFGSPRGPPVPAGSQQRGKLSIPEHLTNCLQKASFEQGARMPSMSLQETPMPTKSLQRAPVAAPKVLACSPHGAPMPEKIPDRQKLKIPEVLKQELLKQKPLASPLKTAPVSCAQGVPVIDKISEKRNLKNPELPRKELLEKDAIIPDTTPVGAPMHVGTQQGAVPPRYPHAAPVSAGSPKGAAVSAHTKKPQASCALAQTLPGAPITSPQGAPIFPRLRAPITSPQGAPISSPQGAPIFPRLRAPITSPQGAPITSPQGAPIFPRLRAPITSPQGAPISSPQRASLTSQRKRVCPWSTAASDNADLCQSPSQKLCVEIDDLIEKVQLILKLDSYNHRAPLIATSQLNQGTQISLQPWKIALDNAGMDQSLPQKKAAYGNQSQGPTVGARSNGLFMEHVR